MLSIFSGVVAVIVMFCIGSSVTDESDKNAKTLKYVNTIGEDGSYEYSFLTNNTISQSQSSKKKEGSETSELEVTGTYYYLSPEGYLVRVTYTSGSKGFRSKSDILSPDVLVEDRISYEALASLQGGGIGKR